MKVAYRVDQRTAVLAGSDFYGEITVNVDPGVLSQEQREELVRCELNGSIFMLEKYRDPVGNIELAPGAVKGDGYVLEILNARIAARKNAAKEREEKAAAAVDEFLTTPDEECDYKYADGNYYCCSVGEKRYVELPADNAQVKEKVQRLDEIDNNRRAQKRQQELEEEERKKLQCETWFAKNGTENQKRRHELGLLPKDEIIDCMRDEAFLALKEFPRFKQLNRAHLTECKCHKPTPYFQVSDGKEVTAEQFETLERISDTIKAVDGSADVKFVQHVGFCESCRCGHTDPSAGRTAKVSLKFGEFLFSREYQL